MKRLKFIMIYQIFLITIIVMPKMMSAQEDIDKMIIHPGWNWVSFPAQNINLTERTAPSSALLKNMQPFPFFISMLGCPLSKSTYYQFLNYDEVSWSGDLSEIQGTFGYKLLIQADSDAYIPLRSPFENPSSQITLYPGHENWAGYFLPETQGPLDAIPRKILLDLESIQAQYWFCYNFNYIKTLAKHPTNEAGNWHCWCNKGDVAIKNHQMLVLDLGINADRTFSWNHTGIQKQEIVEKPGPVHFIFREQEDYKPLILFFDRMDKPGEIGAFAGDSCIGATRVSRNDTTAMICAYIKGFKDKEITLNLFSPETDAVSKIDDYLVMNTTTGIMEKRNIRCNESQPLYFISFKQEDDINLLGTKSIIHCDFDRKKEELSVSYFIPAETDVNIILSNSQGMELKEWNQGRQGPGNYRLSFKSGEFPDGYYQITLKARYDICHDKFQILR